MVTLDDRAKLAVRKIGLNPDDIGIVLSRIATAVPHIGFKDWSLFEEEEVINTNDPWAHFIEDGAHCHLFIDTIHIATDIFPKFERIYKEDLDLLNHMAREASRLLKAAIETSISLSDFGMHAVSLALADTMGLPSQRIGSYFKFLRAISGETYENQRLSYGLILTKTKQEDASAVLEFDNKRVKRLTDGFSTALCLGKSGGIIEIIALNALSEKKNSVLGRPWWLAALADTADQRGGLGIALTKGGDILVVHQRELLFSQRAGEWRVWRHSAILGAIGNSWQAMGRKFKLSRVLKTLYKVALDLSFRRSGGLLVIAESRSTATKLVNAAPDMSGSETRTKAERALDKSLSGTSILAIDRRILADLASLDGALVVDRTGALIAYGAMVTSKKKTGAQGARTRAAIGASMLGIAIKISSDGGITVYRNGFEILTL